MYSAMGLINFTIIKMNRKLLSICAGILCAYVSVAQQASDSSSRNLNIGGYGQIDYNQPMKGSEKSIGNLDVHRVVLLAGYKFSEKTNILTEIEFEHVQEVYVEQAYLSHKLHKYVTFKGGLILTPFGYINERHEPTEFNGVERPNLDGSVIPTTWREVGAGFSGNITDASLKYQAYIMNGFASYIDGAGKLGGSKSFRSGRQKGAESFISSPNIALKINHYGVQGLNIGLSYFGGKTQSDAYNGIEKSDKAALSSADSTVVGLSMVGFDAQYRTGNVIFRTEAIYASVSDNKAYNEKAGKDLADAVFGYWVDIAYDYALHSGSSLRPFVRFEQYNNHFATYFDSNDAYNITELVVGAGYFPANGTVLKIDYQLKKSVADDEFGGILNAGIGFSF